MRRGFVIVDVFFNNTIRNLYRRKEQARGYKRQTVTGTLSALKPFFIMYARNLFALDILFSHVVVSLMND